MRTVLGSFAEQVDQAPADFLDVITAHPFKTSGALLSNSAQRLCNGLLILRLVDPVIVPHFLQHPVPSRQRAVHVLFRAVVGWSLRQYGEIGHFVEFEVAHVLVEIRAGGGLNAISRSEEPPSELQSLMRSSDAVFSLKKKKKQ